MSDSSSIPGGVTVDPNTLALLQRSHQVLMQMNGDPKSRPLLEDALKVIIPDVKTEREIAAELVAPQIAAFEEKLKPALQQLETIAADRQAYIERSTTEQLESAFNEMRTKRGLTDDGIEKVKQLMVERSIADPHAAAALFLEQNPPQSQEAPSWTPQHWNMDQQTGGDAESLKALFADEDRWADNMAGVALTEHRQQVDRIGVG